MQQVNSAKSFTSLSSTPSVRFRGCMLQCSVGLLCDNLGFAGGSIKPRHVLHVAQWQTKPTCVVLQRQHQQQFFQCSLSVTEQQTGREETKAGVMAKILKKEVKVAAEIASEHEGDNATTFQKNTSVTINRRWRGQVATASASRSGDRGSIYLKATVPPNFKKIHLTINWWCC